MQRPFCTVQLSYQTVHLLCCRQVGQEHWRSPDKRAAAQETCVGTCQKLIQHQLCSTCCVPDVLAGRAATGTSTCRCSSASKLLQQRVPVVHAVPVASALVDPRLDRILPTPRLGCRGSRTGAGGRTCWGGAGVLLTARCCLGLGAAAGAGLCAVRGGGSCGAGLRA
jgi:hypothetical protein